MVPGGPEFMRTFTNGRLLDSRDSLRALRIAATPTAGVDTNESAWPAESWRAYEGQTAPEGSMFPIWAVSLLSHKGTQ